MLLHMPYVQTITRSSDASIALAAVDSSKTLVLPPEDSYSSRKLISLIGAALLEDSLRETNSSWSQEEKDCCTERHYTLAA
jgi:hypothetical protein